MKYIIKNISTGEFLRQGDIYFVWTPDIYFARVFKGLKGAQTVLSNIIRRETEWGGPKKHEYKIMGIEMKEVEL